MFSTIRIFQKVVKTGSFSAAARSLNMAPSSVARSIDALEGDLRISLFKRSTRQLILTEKGQEFLSGSSTIVSDMDHLCASLTADIQEPEGTLRISTFESFGRIHLCPNIPEFLMKYPKVNIEVELENKLTDLTRDNIDLAIRVGNPVDSTFISRNLLSNHTFICATQEYLNSNPPLNTPEDIKNHNCLILNQTRQRNHWYFKKDNQNLKIPISGNFKSNAGTPLLETALKGLGLLQLSHWMVQKHIDSGALVPCLTDWTASLNQKSSGSIYALYPQSNFPNPLIKLFVNFMFQTLQSKSDLR